MTKERIKEVRESLEMTRQEFATALNASMDSVEAWENGRRNISSVFAEKVQELARIGKKGAIRNIVAEAGDTVIIRVK
jgi:DNA-binding transcriptional regulator YiaG